MAGGEHGLEQGQGTDRVVAEVDLGALHAFAGFDQRGKMHDAVELSFAQSRFQQDTIVERSVYQERAIGNGRLPAVSEIVIDRHLVARSQKETADGSADVSGTARD